MLCAVDEWLGTTLPSAVENHNAQFLMSRLDGTELLVVL